MKSMPTLFKLLKKEIQDKRLNTVKKERKEKKYQKEANGIAIQKFSYRNSV